MENKKPPFVITNRIIDYVAEIAELVGKLDSAKQPDPDNSWFPCHRAKHAFVGAGDSGIGRQAGLSASKGYC